MDREDLGAQFARITRRLIELERPLLAAHGLSMWEYVVLSELRSGPARTQLELARAIKYDKTRLIALLDRLGDQGLVRRTADPRDRRARIVELTDAGARRVEEARQAIHAMEDHLLDGLSAPQRHNLDRVLAVLQD